MKRSAVVWEIAAWTVFFPIALVLAARRMLGCGHESPEGRVSALLAWYPEAWRRQHGEPLGEVLLDTIEDGRDGVGVSLDVAREGVAERVRAFDPARLTAATMLVAGHIAFFPQGVVAAVLSLFDVPPSWFVALYFDGPERWLVIAAMITAGLLLIERSLWIVRERYAPGYGLSQRWMVDS